MKGVIAAAATAIQPDGAPDISRTLDHYAWLLENGCDGLNILGTTGEATSLSRDQRLGVMEAAAKKLPLDRLMVGTGAAALADTIVLTRAAGDLGYHGALVLPPFYYKGVSEDGLIAFMDRLVEACETPLYLYHFPQMTGIGWSLALIQTLRQAFGARLVGLKDSSGDMAYASALASREKSFAVFPSNEAVLPEARAGLYAGCISATANLNAPFCKKAYHNGDQAALDKAVAIRRIFDGKPLVSGVKSVLSHLKADPNWRRVLPPLVPPDILEDERALSAFKALN